VAAMECSSQTAIDKVPSRYLVDAHLHWQDPRLGTLSPDLQQVMDSARIGLAVVNGTSQRDWPLVHALKQRSLQVVPAFGLHPWYIEDRSASWLFELSNWLKQGRAVMGEIGLDRWHRRDNMEDQVRVFLDQWALANELGCSVTIHCLKAWGRLLELIKAHPHRGPGFLIHSYSGPAEMIPHFMELGAFFSISGYFAHDRKVHQLAAFKTIPMHRLLLETDAPDMLPPPSCRSDEWNDPQSGEAINHPSNIEAIYRFVAKEWGMRQEELEEAMQQNARILFGAALG